MAHRYKSDLTWDDVTPKEMYLNRRQIMAGGGRFLGRGLSAARRRRRTPGT
jgi:sulfoxide reductase catalytic subunit YedY